MELYKQIIKPNINTTSAVLAPDEYVHDTVIYFYASNIEEALEKQIKHLESMELYFREYTSDLVEVRDSRSTATFGCC